MLRFSEWMIATFRLFAQIPAWGPLPVVDHRFFPSSNTRRTPNGAPLSKERFA